MNGALDGNRVKTYLKNSMYPLMYLFGKNSMPDVDNLLTSFYQLDDEARKEVVETIQFKLQYHRDPERAEQIKQIKDGKKIAPVNICVHWSYLRKYYIYFLILPFTQDDSLAILLLYQKHAFRSRMAFKIASISLTVIDESCFLAISSIS